MKKLDVTNPLTTLAGEPITTQDGVKLTLMNALIESLLHPESDDKNLSGEIKLRKFLLAEKIYKTQQFVELDLDEIKLIEPCLAKVFNTLIAGQVLRLLK